MIKHIARIDNPESIKKILDAFDEHEKEKEKNKEEGVDEHCLKQYYKVSKG